MHLELEELGTSRVIASPELRDRADYNPWTERRLHYLVRHQGEEVAFLSFDLWPARDFIVLYELFVVERHRRKGIGTVLVKKALGVAAARGCKRVIVRPVPLSDDISQARLVAWYRALGFQPRINEPDTLEKGVGDPPSCDSAMREGSEG